MDTPNMTRMVIMARLYFTNPIENLNAQERTVPAPHAEELDKVQWYNKDLRIECLGLGDISRSLLSSIQNPTLNTQHF